jgi:hypothetical protein
MYKIDTHNISEEFLNAWRFAGKNLTNQGQGSLSWIRSHLYQPFDDHLSFRVGNQIFSVLVEVENSFMESSLTDQERNNQAKFCSSNNLVPCIYKVKKNSQGEYESIYQAWNLVHAETERPINPVELISEDLIEMSPWEVHDVGVQIVVNNIEKEGGEIFSHQSVLKIDPSIWFKRDGKGFYVIVRAVRYPELDAKRPENLMETIKAIKSMKSPEGKAEGYFASVGIANADNPSEGENPLPLYRGGGMHIRFTGIEKLSQ